MPPPPPQKKRQMVHNCMLRKNFVYLRRLAIKLFNTGTTCYIFDATRNTQHFVLYKIVTLREWIFECIKTKPSFIKLKMNKKSCWLVHCLFPCVGRWVREQTGLEKLYTLSIEKEQADTIHAICSFIKRIQNVNNAEWVSCIISFLISRNYRLIHSTGTVK